MNELEPRIHDKSNGLDYVLVGDYYMPDLRLDELPEQRPIGKWGRMHRRFIEEECPALYTELVLAGELWSHVSDIDEQARARYECIMEQMKAREGVNEELKRTDWWMWVQNMNNIRSQAEEIILKEIIYN